MITTTHDPLPRPAAHSVLPDLTIPDVHISAEWQSVRLASRPVWAPHVVTALQITLAAFFLLAGAAALTDTPAPGVDFELLTDLTGAGAWLRLLTGTIEVAGAVLLAIPALAGVGAAALAALMAASAAAYIGVLHVPPTLPGVLLLLLISVAYVHRAALARVGKFLERNL